MAQIPLGPGTRVQSEVAQNRVIAPDTRAQDRANQQIAGTLQNVGLNILDQRNREEQALSRVKADNALIDRESQIKTIANDLDEQMRTGKLSYEKAPEAYNTAVSKLDPLDTPGLDPEQQGAMGNVLKRMQIRGLEGVQQAAEKGRIQSAQSDLVSRMDMLGKDAAMPGANVEQINARMDAEDVDVAGRLAFGEAWTHKKQEFKDGNWTTHATQRVIESRESIGSLQKLEHDLTAEDGFYARKLDPDKRNQLLNTVTGRIFQVQEHQQRQAEMREVKAERILTQMDRQAATGVPPPPALQQQWQAGLKGTSAAGEFNTRMQEMNEVQGLLRQPPAVAQQYIDQQRQQMQSRGGTVAQQANLDRLQTAVNTNNKLLREDPLTLNALKTGVDVDPLDVSGVMTKEGQEKLVGQISERFDVIASMGKSYGPETARVPFKGAELEMLKAFMDQANDSTKLQVLGAIAAAAPNGASYAAAIKPLTEKQPVTVIAGMAQYLGLKGEDGTDIPKTLMAGAKILKDKSIPAPEEPVFTAAFDKFLGSSMPAGTKQRDQAYQGFKAIYAGLADASGVRYKEGTSKLDSDISEKAIQMITGGIVERAGAKVIKPYDMSEGVFNGLVDMQLEGLAMHSKLPINQLEDMPLSPVPGREGSYYLMNAGRVQVDPKTNQPMVVKVK